MTNAEISWVFEVAIPNTGEMCYSCPHCGGWVTFQDKPDYPICPWCGERAKLEVKEDGKETV